MKFAIIWNVWNTYEDVLIASEMAHHQNREKEIFEELHMISQGAYPTPPSEEEKKYLEGHFDVPINENFDMIKNHPKWRGCYRVYNGIKQAYEFALAKGCDFALVTNGDTWCFDMLKIRRLLERDDMQAAAVSLRVGKVLGLDLNYGEYAPFFEEHFLFLNINKCKEHRVFDYKEPKAYNAIFRHGGFHYILQMIMEERVPPGLLNAYTHLTHCVNHYGERSGYNLLPWQYDPEWGFLHANCAQDEYLHPLRAAFLKHLGLDKYHAAKRYCKRHLPQAKNICYSKDYVYFRKSLRQKLAIAGIFNFVRLFHLTLYWFKYRKYAETKKRSFNFTESSTSHYFAMDHILPINLVSRKTG
jgi:hypothetical protein